MFSGISAALGDVIYDKEEDGPQKEAGDGDHPVGDLCLELKQLFVLWQRTTAQGESLVQTAKLDAMQTAITMRRQKLEGKKTDDKDAGAPKEIDFIETFGPALAVVRHADFLGKVFWRGVAAQFPELEGRSTMAVFKGWKAGWCDPQKADPLGLAALLGADGLLSRTGSIMIPVTGDLARELGLI